MNHAKRLIALLYASADPLPKERLRTLLQLSEKSLREALREADMLLREMPFQLHEDAQGYRLILRQAYADIAQLVNPEADLSRQAVDVLALIAYTQPVMQSQLTRVLGNVYDTLRTLEERGFIKRERKGRSYEIRLDTAFYRYFEIPHGEEKDLLQRLAAERGISLPDETTLREAEVAEEEGEAETTQEEGIPGETDTPPSSQSKYQSSPSLPSPSHESDDASRLVAEHPAASTQETVESEASDETHDEKPHESTHPGEKGDHV